MAKSKKETKFAGIPEKEFVTLESSRILKAHFKEDPNSTNLKVKGIPQGILTLVFKKDRVYRYDGVPTMIYNSLVGAESAGKYFEEHIKDVYDFEEVTN